MTKSTRERRTTEGWNLEPAEAVLKAIRYFAKQRQDGSLLKKPRSDSRTTLVMKAHTPSTKKIRQLLETHIHVTNLAADIVEQWQEDPAKPRDDGAVAACFAVQTSGTFGSYRSRVLSGILEKQFEPRHHGSTVLPRIRLGTYRDMAQMYIGTVTKLGTRILEDVPENTALDMPTFYRNWKNILEAHQRATETVLAVSMDPGSPYRLSDYALLRRSKREARRLLANLRPEEQIHMAVVAVDKLLEQRQDDEALYTTHVFKTGARHRRRIRQNWLLQYAESSDDSSAVLGSLNRHELEAYRAQLLEMIEFLERAYHTVEELQVSEEAHVQDSTSIDYDDVSQSQTGVVEHVRSALETFLFDRPASFPTVQRVAIVDDPGSRLGWWVYDAEACTGKGADIRTKAQLVEAYDKAMEWFQYYWHSTKDLGRFASAEEEAKAVQQMFATLRHLRPPRLRPITFVGTMSPTKYVDGKRKGAQYRDCALLYEQPIINGVQTTRFIFAAFLQKRRDSDEADLRDRERRKYQLAKYQERRSTNPMYFVNAPLTPFHVPEGHDVLLLPLECGQNYAEQLLALIAQQRAAQRVAHEAAKHVPIERCMSAHMPFKSARITCAWNDNDEPEFYVHLHLALDERPQQQLPSTYLGVTLRDGRPAYAVVDSDGTILRAADIPIPKSLDPEWNARHVSDNLLHWIANSIIARAVAWDAIIGVEDTSRRSNTRNAESSVARAPFELPLKRLFAMLIYKAHREGLLAPRLISNVSPAGDCGTCQTRFASGTKTTLIARTITCNVCYHLSMQPLAPTAPAHHTCTHAVSFAGPEASLEQWFICPNCQKPLLARHNRATVTAKRMSIDIVRHATNSQAKKKRESKQADAVQAEPSDQVHEEAY